MPSRPPTIETVIFLGAGASRAEGAPLQGELFREYFLHCNENGDAHSHQWDSELVEFFSDFFGIHVANRDEVRSAQFPTFEEVLGIIELANMQGENFRGWPSTQADSLSCRPRLEHVHDVLIFLIAEILDFKLRDPATHHPKLVSALQAADMLRSTSFVSLNYDILIDNAMLRARDDYDLDLDYSIGFMNFGPQWKRPRPKKSIRLFKLHGSLNWLYCPTCRTIRITPKEKGICRLKWRPQECTCSTCDTLAVPVIIPPTYFKALSNLYLREIWHAAEQSLQECRRIIFCGYSFPDADVHVRYLLKRTELHRTSPIDVHVVNEHEGKTEDARTAERNRYRRFFADKTTVHYTDISFEEFAADPEIVEDVTRWMQ